MGNANILIIEDDEDIREGIRILLESEDYQITEAADGWEGLRLLSDDTDLVILDIMMPGISGLKTCEEIRKTSFVPVLFLTAKAQAVSYTHLDVYKRQAPHCVLSQSSKHSQSAHFSAKNGFLLMFLAGPKIKNLHASKLASDFQPFDPGIMSYFGYEIY